MTAIMQSIMASSAAQGGPTGPHDSQIYVGSNSYLTFGAGATSLWGDGFPRIMINAGNLSYQKVYEKNFGLTYRVRYEGSFGSSYDPAALRIWEVEFFKNNPSRIDLHLDTYVYPLNGISGIRNAAGTSFAQFFNTSFRYYSITSTANSVSVTDYGLSTPTPIGPTFLGPSDFNVTFSGDVDDGFTKLSVPFPVRLLGTSY